MSQFDFGTMDPYVVDGVQLADSLNQWRDALHGMHRGASRPPYAVAGMMWINDSAGATNWVVNIYLGPPVAPMVLGIVVRRPVPPSSIAVTRPRQSGSAKVVLPSPPP